MILWILFGFIAVTVLLLIALITLPIVLSGHVSGGSDTGLDYHGNVMVFGGMIGGAVKRAGTEHLVSLMVGRFHVMRFRISPESTEFKKTKPKKEKKTRTKETKPKASFGERITSSIRDFNSYWPRVKQLYHDIWYIVLIDRFTGQVTFGFTNPALTGKLIGAIAVINRFLPDPFVIEQSFDFTRRVLRGGLDIQLTVRPDRFWRRIVTYIPLLYSIYRERRQKTRRISDEFIVQEGV